ncbi:MAG: MMPL family transporter [Syntrophales bacterium]|nr:MMPL family transporter [Syntrophales bacterium]
MNISNEVIIYSTVFILSFITFYVFLKIGVKKIAAMVTARPVFYITTSLIIVAVLGIGIKNLTLEPDMKVLLPENMASVRTFDRIEQLFGGLETVYVCVTAKDGTVWDAHILSRIHEMSKKIKTSPHVDRILSITDMKSISNKDDMMEVSSIVPENATEIKPEDVAGIRSKVKENDLASKRLISPDEKSALIVAQINMYIQETKPNGTKTTRLVQDKEFCEPTPDNPDKPTFVNIMNEFADPAYKITISGFPFIRYNLWLQMAADLKVFLILGVVVMLVFLYVSFRTLRGMLLPLIVVLLSVIASFGFMGWMKEKITLPFVIMGPMLIAIAHNYGTQLIAKYYEDVQDARGRLTRDDVKQIAGHGIVSIGAPVFISAITVIIGFVTMISHPIRGLALLGFFCAFGIIAAFNLTILFHTAILSYISVPKMLIEKNHGAATDRFLKAIAKYTIRRKYGMLAAVLILALCCVYFIPKIKVDANMMNQFPKKSEVYREAQFITDNFGGYSTLNILIEAVHPVAADSPEDGPMKDPGILKWMDGFEEYVLEQKDPRTNEKLVGDALSISDLVSYMNRIMKNDPKENRVPDTRNLIAQYLLSYENQSSGEFAGLVDYKYNNAQMVIRLPDMSTSRLKAITDQLKTYLTDHPNPDIRVSFSGPAEINAEVGNMIVEGQLWSLSLSVILIVVCYMIFFRSFAAGMVAVVPLLCAIVLVFGIMGVMHIPLDYITATLTGISIGAGTDYTAYFLWRLRERSRLRDSLEDGYVDTMTSIGKGIVYNGFSVVVGFFVFFFSNFIPMRFFGFLVSFSIFACIIGTLTILPVVIFMTKPAFLMRKKTIREQE